MDISWYISKFHKNLVKLLSEEENLVDFKKMIESHTFICISHIDFFNLKFIFWKVFRNFEASYHLTMKFLSFLERFRYLVDIRKYVLMLFDDPNFRT